MELPHTKCPSVRQSTISVHRAVPRHPVDACCPPRRTPHPIMDTKLSTQWVQNVAANIPFEWAVIVG